MNKPARETALDQAYLERLRVTVKQIGLNALCQETGYSKAQMFRYLNGSDIPSQRLATIAQMANTTTDWILFGHDPARVKLADTVARLQHVTETVLSTLQTHYVGKAWKPSEIKELIPFFLLNETLPGKFESEWRLTEAEVLRTLYALDALRGNRQLADYTAMATRLLSNDNEEVTADWGGPFCGYVHAALTSYYNSEAAQVFYERTAHHIKPHLQQVWYNNLLNHLETKRFTNKPVLVDIGVGSGRFLRYLHRNFPD